MGRSEPEAASLHPTQQLFQNKFVPVPASIGGPRPTFLTKRMKKMTAIMVVDVSQDGDTACDVRRRFMHPAMPMPDGVSYSARCRQLRVLAGDRHHFPPLPSGQCSTRAKDYRQRQIRRFFTGGSSKNVMWTFGYFKKSGRGRDKQYIRKGHERLARAGGLVLVDSSVQPANETLNRSLEYCTDTQQG